MTVSEAHASLQPCRTDSLERSASPLRGWISVTEFIHAHHCEVEWHAGLEEGWVDGQWIDQSGVMVSARVHANGTVEAVPGALREADTAARFGVG